MVRTWDGPKYKYSQMGKRFFAGQKKEYVIEVPFKIKGRRSVQEQGWTRTRDSTYERHAFMHVSHFGVAAIFANVLPAKRSLRRGSRIR